MLIHGLPNTVMLINFELFWTLKYTYTHSVINVSKSIFRHCRSILRQARHPLFYVIGSVRHINQKKQTAHTYLYTYPDWLQPSFQLFLSPPHMGYKSGNLSRTYQPHTADMEQLQSWNKTQEDIGLKYFNN